MKHIEDMKYVEAKAYAQAFAKKNNMRLVESRYSGFMRKFSVFLDGGLPYYLLTGGKTKQEAMCNLLKELINKHGKDVMYGLMC